MKNFRIIWFFAIGIVIAGVVFFNYQGQKKAVSLTEIFPEEEVYPVDVEYEFVDHGDDTASGESNDIPSLVSRKVIEKKVEEAPVLVKQKANVAVVSSPVTKIESAKTKESDSWPATIETKKGVYTIQIASFKKKDSAREELKKIKQKDYPAFIVARNLGDRGTWYRIYVGQFQKKAEADQYLTQLKTQYKNSFVLKQ